MVVPRRLAMSLAALALAMVALVSASGYDGQQVNDRAHASHHLPHTPGAFIATAPVLVQRAALPTGERRVPRGMGFVLVALAVAAGLAAAAEGSLLQRADQVRQWRFTACGRRGPPAARLAV